MILSCAEVHFDKPDPSFRQWIVGATATEAADGIMKCGKIPKPHEENDKYPGWKCCRIEAEPIEGSDGTWRVSAHFEPVVTVAEASDEPTFPPFAGPKGNQPDGSFILTPRCVHALEEMIAHKWSPFKQNDHNLKYIEKLQTAIYEETGVSFMELT